MHPTFKKPKSNVSITRHLRRGLLGHTRAFASFFHSLFILLSFITSLDSHPPTSALSSFKFFVAFLVSHRFPAYLSPLSCTLTCALYLYRTYNTYTFIPVSLLFYVMYVLLPSHLTRSSKSVLNTSYVIIDSGLDTISWLRRIGSINWIPGPHTRPISGESYNNNMQLRIYELHGHMYTVGTSATSFYNSHLWFQVLTWYQHFNPMAASHECLWMPRSRHVLGGARGRRNGERSRDFLSGHWSRANRMCATMLIISH